MITSSKFELPRLHWWLIGSLFLSLSACSGIIKIERLPTPTPLPPPPVTTPVAATSDIPERLMIDKISLDAPVVEMGWTVQGEGVQAASVWNVPDDEAGWHLNSAAPGQGSNVVISGHNNSTGGHVFGDLEDLDVGDEISLRTSDGQTHRYQISETRIVRAFGASAETLAYLREIMQPTPNERLTLITCWPSWTNTHRLIVMANPA